MRLPAETAALRYLAGLPCERLAQVGVSASHSHSPPLAIRRIIGEHRSIAIGPPASDAIRDLPARSEKEGGSMPYPAKTSSQIDPALVDHIDLLVRPGRVILVPGQQEDLLHRETGSGSGRIAKDTVTNSEQLIWATRAASRLTGELPLLVSVNQEGCRLDALDWPSLAQLPGNLALGAVGEPDLAVLAGAAIGGQLRAAGLTWNLAPVCDTASWPSTSAVGTRSFGSGVGRGQPGITPDDLGGGGSAVRRATATLRSSSSTSRARA